jgi:probable addiction module antidote protein
LKDPTAAAEYLDAIMEEGDEATLLLALRQVAQAQGGIASVARSSRLSREATYRMLSKSGNPELRSLSAALRTMGLRLSVKTLTRTGQKSA